ncbi:MAG: PD40 domain-containing protein, partial [Microthrixaceae bacterium]|nr:PD40 domain-containing protein [Microthrixaceae bacterium]
DGSIVAFVSEAADLVEGDTNGASDVFIKDRRTGATTRVSVASDGTQSTGPAFGWHTAASLSADGRYVAFSSSASDLVPGDTNGAIDVFVHDRVTGQTTRVSVASDGTEGNLNSFSPGISADGRYVVFYSSASTLVDDDTNNLMDTFVHDRVTGETTRVSVASDGSQGEFGKDWSPAIDGSPSISADGRLVAFVSIASSLVPNDTNGSFDAFVHNRDTGETSLVSASLTGGVGNLASHTAMISADGRYVAFDSGADNLTTEPPRSSDQAWNSVFVRDLQTNTTRAIVQSWRGSEWERGYLGSISANGRYVAFRSDSNQIIFGDREFIEHADRVFVADLWNGTTRVMSLEHIRGEAVATSTYPKLSSDGSTLAFTTYFKSPPNNPELLSGLAAGFAVNVTD